MPVATSRLNWASGTFSQPFEKYVDSESVTTSPSATTSTRRRWMCSTSFMLSTNVLISSWSSAGIPTAEIVPRP